MVTAAQKKLINKYIKVVSGRFSDAYNDHMDIPLMFDTPFNDSLKALDCANALIRAKGKPFIIFKSDDHTGPPVEIEHNTVFDLMRASQIALMKYREKYGPVHPTENLLIEGAEYVSDTRKGDSKYVCLAYR